MSTPRWIDTKLSVGNIITIMVVAAGVVGGWYARDTEIARNKAAIESVQRDVARVVVRVDKMEDYQDETIDRLARIEEQMQSINSSLSRILNKLGTP